MFTAKHRVISGIILFTLCTCSYPDRQASKSSPALIGGQIAKSSRSPAITSNPAREYSKQAPKNFIDSVQAKLHLSFRQIKEHTNIDSAYCRDHVRFLGDTVWYRNRKHPLAIIRFGNGGIKRKLLLVFNQRGECTASLTVGMDGDIDAFDSVVRNYKISDDNSFSTTETWTYRGGSKEDKVTITKQFYRINKKGNILAQDNIIHSSTRPKGLAAR